METIYAPATARGKAGISIIRISGPQAHQVVNTMCGSCPPPQRASLRKVIWHDVQIDEAIVTIYEIGHSFTGEAMAEFHLHGSVAVMAAALLALSEQPGLRQAEPGEFTRRALENGRLDLTQVEGLADLIEAETEAQRKQALRVLSGAVGKKAETWRKKLIRAAALLEATIDFVDEDVPVDVMPEVGTILTYLLNEFRAEAAGARIAERLRDGFEIAIIGEPNVGKSSLLNALADREAAITSEFAGTTRDVIEVRMDLGGFPVSLLDTAGLRETNDPVEAMGIARAKDRAAAADLRIILTIDGSLPSGIVPRNGDIVVRNKADLIALSEDEFAISAKTRLGICELLDKVQAELERRVSGTLTLSRDRHRRGIVSAIGCLEQALLFVEHGPDVTELVAESIRRAMLSLDELVGRVDVENLLNEIFASFCIGK